MTEQVKAVPDGCHTLTAHLVVRGAARAIDFYKHVFGAEEMMPALEKQAPDGRESWRRGLEGLHPFWMLQHLSNNAHALVSVALTRR